MVEASEPTDLEGSCLEYAVFGSIRAVAATLKQRRGTNPLISRVGAFQAYADDERSHCASALQSLFGDAKLLTEITGKS